MTRILYLWAEPYVMNCDNIYMMYCIDVMFWDELVDLLSGIMLYWNQVVYGNHV